LHEIGQDFSAPAVQMDAVVVKAPTVKLPDPIITFV
jgi:hypothetical protein